MGSGSSSEPSSVAAPTPSLAAAPALAAGAASVPAPALAPVSADATAAAAAVTRVILRLYVGMYTPTRADRKSPTFGDERFVHLLYDEIANGLLGGSVARRKLVLA